MEFFEHLIRTLPLELFVFIGTVIDEIVSPIPAFIVLIPAGIAAHVQEHGVAYLFLLAVISAIARMLAGYVLYLLADKLEDVLFANDRRLFGTSHKEIEAIGKKLGKYRAHRSWLTLFAMHALPVFPGTLLSLGSGFIRLKPVIFLTATLAGSLISALFFLYVGYAGIQTATLLAQLDQISQVVTVILIIALIIWLIVRHKEKAGKGKVPR